MSLGDNVSVDIFFQVFLQHDSQYFLHKKCKLSKEYTTICIHFQLQIYTVFLLKSRLRAIHPCMPKFKFTRNFALYLSTLIFNLILPHRVGEPSRAEPDLTRLVGSVEPRRAEIFCTEPKILSKGPIKCE